MWEFSLKKRNHRQFAAFLEGWGALVSGLWLVGLGPVKGTPASTPGLESSGLALRSVTSWVTLRPALPGPLPPPVPLAACVRESTS